MRYASGSNSDWVSWLNRSMGPRAPQCGGGGKSVTAPASLRSAGAPLNPRRHVAYLRPEEPLQCLLFGVWRKPRSEHATPTVLSKLTGIGTRCPPETQQQRTIAMLDPKQLRTELDQVAQALARRGFTLDTERYRAIEARRKALQVETQELQNERNQRSKAIGQAKARGEDVQPLLEAVSGISERLKANEQALDALQKELDELHLSIPNIPHPSVPDGLDEESNQEVRRWGEPPSFDFKPLDHVELGAIH